VLAEIVDLLLIALQHGHQLTIQPNSDNYALDISIGTSGAEEALGAEEIITVKSAPYSAAGRPENRRKQVSAVRQPPGQGPALQANTAFDGVTQ
jgi:hypothetical protein